MPPRDSLKIVESLRDSVLALLPYHITATVADGSVTSAQLARDSSGNFHIQLNITRDDGSIFSLNSDGKGVYITDSLIVTGPTEINNSLTVNGILTASSINGTTSNDVTNIGLSGNTDSSATGISSNGTTNSHGANTSLSGSISNATTAVSLSGSTASGSASISVGGSTGSHIAGISLGGSTASGNASISTSGSTANTTVSVSVSGTTAAANVDHILIESGVPQGLVDVLPTTSADFDQNEAYFNGTSCQPAFFASGLEVFFSSNWDGGTVTVTGLSPRGIVISETFTNDNSGNPQFGLVPFYVFTRAKNNGTRTNGSVRIALSGGISPLGYDPTSSILLTVKYNTAFTFAAVPMFFDTIPNFSSSGIIFPNTASVDGNTQFTVVYRKVHTHAATGLSGSSSAHNHSATGITVSDSGHSHAASSISITDTGHTHSSTGLTSADAGHSHSSSGISVLDSGHTHANNFSISDSGHTHGFSATITDTGHAHSILGISIQDAGHKHNLS